jgi:colicin import membrane protein
MSKLTCQTKLDNLTNLNTKLDVEDVEIETKKRNMEKKINKSIEVLEEMKKHCQELMKHDQEMKNYDLNEIENLIVYMRQSKMKNFIAYMEHSIEAENVSMSNKDKKAELNLADAFFDNSIYSLEKTLKKDRIALKNIIKINNKKAKEADIKAKDKAKKKEIAKIKAQLKALADDKANKSVDEEIKAAEIKAAEIKAAEIKAAAEAKAKAEAEVKEKAERKARAEANKIAKAEAKAEVEARIKAKLKQRQKPLG